MFQDDSFHIMDETDEENCVCNFTCVIQEPKYLNEIKTCHFKAKTDKLLLIASRPEKSGPRTHDTFKN